MRLLPRRLLLTLILATAMGAGAHAQTRADDSTVLPVWNQTTGKVEALLLLEPANETAVNARWRFSEGALDAAFGLNAGDSLGLLCDRKTGIASAIGHLVNNCMLASLGEDGAGGSRHASAGLSLTKPNSKLGLTVGSGHDTLPAWLSPSGKARVEQNDLTVFGQKNIGREGVVTIGGTVARARLVSAADFPALADRWNAKSLSVGGGYGAFSANIIGRVVDVPGQSSQWQGLGLGLTWRTPWSGQLTVGADNVVTRGKNPFAAPAGTDEKGTVPYVRYEQDL
jgi:hypothetical protein